jgi:hypothetical protein
VKLSTALYKSKKNFWRGPQTLASTGSEIRERRLVTGWKGEEREEVKERNGEEWD